MSYPRHPHDDYESQAPQDQPVVAPLALPKDLHCGGLGPDAIIRTDGPTTIGPCGGLEIDPATARSIPYEEWPDEWKNPNARVGVDYVKSENPDVPPTADMFPGNEDLAGLPPMSEWTKFIPQALVHSEFEKLEGWLDQWDRNIEETRVLNERLKRGETVTLTLGEGAVAPEPLALISEVRRLLARYKELWDIASGIVNKEMME